MLYLFWMAINCTALIYFLASCVTAARAVWAKAGLGPLLIVGFGLVSFTSSSSESATRLPRPAGRVWTEALEHKYIKMEDYRLAAIELGMTYAAAPDSGQVVQATTSFTGLKLGISWQPTATRTTIRDHKLYYDVDGFVDWKLLGTTVYRESKQFSGVVPL